MQRLPQKQYLTLIHSAFKLFTGLANATFKVCMTIITEVSNPNETMIITMGIALISMWYS
jgi:hypothetical protein